jgi:hypothetical protein
VPKVVVVVAKESLRQLTQEAIEELQPNDLLLWDNSKEGVKLVYKVLENKGFSANLEYNIVGIVAEVRMGDFDVSDEEATPLCMIPEFRQKWKLIITESICGECEGACPVDDYLCEACRA